MSVAALGPRPPRAGAARLGGEALVAALALIARLTGWLPAFAQRGLGASLGWFCGSVLRIRRRAVEGAMNRAGVASATAAAMFRALGLSVVELLRLRAASPTARPALAATMGALDPETAAALDAAVRRGPVVLLASHTGNWELSAFVAATALARVGRRLAIVVKTQKARGIDRFITDLRASFGIDPIAPHGALARAGEILARGDVVAMPIDQVPDRAAHADVRPFLGTNALADRAPAMLALRAGATVLVVATELPEARGPRNVVRLLGVIPPFAAPSSGGGRREWVRATTARATALLEAHVRAHPASWLWLHRRWRGAPCKGAEPTLIPQP